MNPGLPGRGLLVLLVFLAAGCLPDGQPGGGAQVGQEAPEFRAQTLEGEEVTLADYRGAPVLLNIWATWCPPCRVEIPELQKLHETHGPLGLRVVGVSIDAAGAQGDVVEFAASLGVGYEILLDVPGRSLPTFAFHGVPGTLLVDAQGVIRWKHLGPVTAQDPALVAALEEIFPGV